MLKYFKPISGSSSSSNVNVSNSNAQQVVQLPTPAPPVSPYIEVNLNGLVADPGLRTSIYDYDVNDREKVRRAYLQRGPCQPKNHSFPLREDMNRAFVIGWYKEYTWLEYSIHKDAAYCLVCYLFKPKVGHTGGGEAFVNEGFRNWRKKSRLSVHVGDHSSVHNQCLKACDDLLFQGQHIEVCLSRQSNQVRVNYRIRLNASVDCIRFLLRHGLAFRGHDESEEYENQGNFLELLNFLAYHCEEINKVVLKNALENLKLISPRIQKDIVSAIAAETTNAIIRDVGDKSFAIFL